MFQSFLFFRYLLSKSGRKNKWILVKIRQVPAVSACLYLKVMAKANQLFPCVKAKIAWSADLPSIINLDVVKRWESQ